VTAPRQVTGVVTVGTDHHRFDRLMDWLESWDERNPGAVRWVVQHGSSRLMAGAEGFTIKPRADVLELLLGADLVVTQGGPGGIKDSWECGLLPIVVPRLARLNEVVDDHQVAFAQQLARKGLLVVAESEAELHAALDRALADPGAFRVDVTAGDVTETVARFAAAVDEMLGRKPARISRRARRRQVAGTLSG
jgi:UDP-N-acetylglucosamine transferase subunit ALG13